jgi:hypothetical protein
MKTEIAQKHIQKNIASDDFLIGFFYAIQPFKWWLFFLIGPLAVLSMKSLFVAVTKNGLTFHRLNMLGKFSGSDSFTYKEIENVKIGKGLLQRPMEFKFINGRKLKIKAQLKGVASVAKITEPVQRHIEANINPSK